MRKCGGKTTGEELLHKSPEEEKRRHAAGKREGESRTTQFKPKKKRLTKNLLWARAGRPPTVSRELELPSFAKLPAHSLPRFQPNLLFLHF